MSSNNTGKNVANAFKVVSETCENVEKLIAFLNKQAGEKGEYIPCTSRPLRCRSGEFNDETILVFQKKQDEKIF